MGEFRWYKRDPDAALAGMAELTLEERGAYNTILDLIYSTGGKLKDEERQIAGWLRCDVRVWRRIRLRLIKLGKIYPHNSLLCNARADRELDAVQHRALSAARAGRQSWASRKEKSNIINGSARGSVERPFEPLKNKKERKILSRDRSMREAEDGRASKPDLEASDELAEVIRRKGPLQ